MKKLVYFMLVAIVAGLASCSDLYEEKYWVTLNEPVFMSASEFRNSVNVTSKAEQISDYGKICYYEGYLFISATDKGIHIIDNRTPANPKNIGFIELMGNADISVRDNLLYADSYIDLVWFDISNPAKPVLKGRLENAFPNVIPPCGNTYSIDYSSCYNEQGNLRGIIVGWELQKTKVTKDDLHYRQYYYGADIMYDKITTASASSTGINGSMSRFAMYKDYLYAVINGKMLIFDVSGSAPKLVSEVNDGVFYEVETIFSYKDCMFMGMPSGMAIYSVEDPVTPKYCSWILHIYGCDPVVVDDDLAYVTVRSGNFCGQTIDELMVIDVKDVYKPALIVSYKMVNPKGLGIDSDKKTLFLCDDGLKAFKIGDDPQTLIANQLTHIKGMDGYDLIPFKNTLMMIAEDGLYQYDYSNLNNIKQISVIPIRND